MLSHPVPNHRLSGSISVGRRDWVPHTQHEWRIRKVSSVLVNNPFNACFPVRESTEGIIEVVHIVIGETEIRFLPPTWAAHYYVGKIWVVPVARGKCLNERAPFLLKYGVPRQGHRLNLCGGDCNSRS